MANEADTCRMYVRPKLNAAGWDDAPHSYTEQLSITDGRVVVVGNKVKRRAPKYADFALRYTRDFMIAVVEAKAEYKRPADGLQQGKRYAEMLGVKFVYATNGHGIVEYDYLTGIERELAAFPTPDELWQRLQQGQGLSASAVNRLLTPSYNLSDKRPRYYQEIAINRTVQSILQGKPRVLLTMATGTGKTFVAFQICWKLWSARWNRTGEHRRPKILYLADRNILVDDPMAKMFTPFGDARWKIEGGAINKGREMYFAIYQAIAQAEHRPGLYKEYAPDFFDLIIVDECHRGSASDESNWREILTYFKPAYQLGMTATPLRADNRDTYAYFGNPIYTYSLKQGIEDGFLAPYRVHRIVTRVDALGWRPSAGERDRFMRAIPDKEYQTQEFERTVALRARTEAIAKHLADFMRKTDRFAKTIVFCVDQDHADEMRRALNNLNSDLAQRYPDYVCRVTSDEGDVGRGHLSNFQEPERRTPVILTTSQLLTTGIDAQTCQNIVIARVISSMTEFKQIIGRGTRLRTDYDKYYFNILDYTGSATQLFADPDFDGEPALIIESQMNEAGETVTGSEQITQPVEPNTDEADINNLSTYQPINQLTKRLADQPRKYYVDGGQVEIVAQVVYELDADGNRLRVVTFTDYTAEKVRTLYPSAVELRQHWTDPLRRANIITSLEERGIDFEALLQAANQPNADPFDLLCHIAYGAPLHTRRERADRVRREQAEFFAQFSQEAREILRDLLDKYAEFGVAQFTLPAVLQVPPISQRGNVGEIIAYFGSADKMRVAVNQLQTYLYAV